MYIYIYIFFFLIEFKKLCVFILFYILVLKINKNKKFYKTLLNHL